MRVRELEYKKYKELDDMVYNLVGDSELASWWWLSPNAAFNMKYPYACEEEDVKAYLMWHCYAAGG
jgi:hypothetical protein